MGVSEQRALGAGTALVTEDCFCLSTGTWRVSSATLPLRP